MKLWHHIVAGVVGLSLAGLIVFLVFGNASREGAVQEGAAPGSLRGSGETLCGSVTPAQGLTQPARKKALANPPTLIAAETKREIAIQADKADQLAWVARVHAASGMCIDQVTLANDPNTPTRIAFSTTDAVSDAEASAYVGAAVGQSFTQPLRRLQVVVRATVGERERTATVSLRAWNAFRVRRKSLGYETTMTDIAAFGRRFPTFGIKAAGW